MSICNLDQNKELANSIANKIYNSILKSFKPGAKPFKLIQVVRDVYDAAYKKDNDHTKALGVAAVVPTLFFQVVEDNPKLLTQLLDNNLDLKAIRNFQNVLNSAVDPLKEIAVFINTQNQTSIKVIIDKKQNESPIENEIPVENEVFELFTNKILTSLSLLNTTGQQLAEEKGIPVFTKTDPNKNFYYRVLTNLLNANENENPNFSNVEFGGHTGFKLKPLVENTLSEKDLYPNVDPSSKRIVLALTDNKGNLLYFNSDNQVTTSDNGKVVYFYMKDVSGKNVLKLKEELLRSNEVTLQQQAKNDPIEYSRLKSELISIIDNLVNKQKKEADEIIKSVLENKPLLLDITGGKKGYYENTDDTYAKIKNNKDVEKTVKSLIERTLSQYNLSDDEIESISLAFSDMMVKGSLKTMSLPSIKFKNIEKPVSLKGRNLLAGDRSLFDNMISVLVDDLVFENGKEITPDDRIKYFNNFTKLNEKILTLSNLNSRLAITLNGKELSLTNKEEAKKELAKVLGPVMFANFSTKLKAEVTFEKYNINNGVITPIKTDYIKDFVLQNMIPRIAYDVTTKDPLIVNGYFTFQPTNEEAVVEEKVKTVITETKKIVEDFSDGGLSDLLERSKLIESNATPEQKAKAEAWWKNSSLSKAKDSTGKPLLTLKNAYNLVNSDAWATFSNATITLYQGADYTHVYHEAWHAFSQMYLTKAERDKLYNSAKELPGSFTVIRKNENNNIIKENIDFKDASRKELEEFIAEEFRVYAMNNGKFIAKDSKASIFKSIFDRIWKFFTELFKGTTDINVYSNPGSQGILSEMFNQLYTAKKQDDLNMYSPSINNAEFGVLNSGIINKDKTVLFTPVEATLLVKSIDGIISETTTEYLKQGKYGAAALILKGSQRLTPLYNVVIKNRLAERLETLKNEFEADFIKSSKDKSKWTKFEKDYKRSNVKLLQKALENFGDAKEIFEGKSDKINIISYHLENSAFNENIDENFESPLAKVGRDGGNDVEAYDLASADCVYILKTLLKQEYNANKERVNVLNSLGFPEPINHKQFFNTLMDKVSGEKKIDELYKKLVEARYISPLFAQLIEKLGDPSVVIPANKYAAAIWMGVIRSLNLEREDIVISKFKETSEYQEGVGAKTSIEFTVGKTSADFQSVKNKIWPSKFSMETGPYVKQNTNKENYLLLDEIVKKFLVAKPAGDKGVITYFIKNEALKIPFLNAIGLYLQDNIDTKKALDSDTTNSFQYIVNAIGLANANKDVLKKREMYPITNIVSFLSKKHKAINIELSTGETILGEIDNQASNVNTIAKIDAEFSTENISRMKLNAEKSKKSAFSLNSSFTQIIYALKKALSTEDFKNNNSGYSYVPHLVKENNPHVIGSVIMNSLFDLSGKKVKDNSIELVDISGSQYEELSGETDGVSHGSMTKVDKFITDFASLLKSGYIEAIRHGEKSTYTAVIVKRLNTYKGKINNHLYIDTEAFLQDSNGNYVMGYNPFDKLMDIMIPKLEGELRRIQMIKNKKNYYSRAKDFYNKAIEFDFFDDILNTEDGKLKKLLIDEYAPKLTDENNLSSLLNQDLNLRRTIENEIKNYFEAYKTSIEQNNYNKIFGNNVPEFLKDIAISKVPEGTNIVYNSIKDALLYSFVINSSLHSNEVILLELGDGFQFNHTKDESLKRVPTYNSTGLIFPTDLLARMFINTHVKRPLEDKLVKEGKLVRKNTDQKETRSFDGKGNKVIIKESEVDSIYIDDYAEMFRHWLKKQNYRGNIEEAIYGKGGSATDIKGGLIKPYTKIKDGDGQGWVSFDTYRILKNLENSWTEKQEAAYQKEINGEALTPEELTDLFPVYKLQYAGPLVTELNFYPIQSIDKFSLFPLIPSVIKDKPLEKMHLAMMAQNIDYALFDSGAKRSYLRADDKTNGDVIYKDNTSEILDYQDINFTANPIYFEYLKNQTEVNKYYKGKSILSTQLRKVFNVGVFNQGVPVDYTGTKEEWNKLSKTDKKAQSKVYKNTEKVYSRLKRLTQFMRKDLLNELGWKEVNGKLEGNIEDMITFVTDLLKSQGYSQHEIDFIQFKTDKNGKKKVDLSTSPQANRLEKLLMSVINNRLIKLKINGEPLVQLSSAFTQSFTKPTKEQKKLYDDFGTNGLSGYIVSKDGTKETIGAKVKVALTENYQNLFNTNYYVNDKPVGKIAVYDKKVEDGKTSYILNYDESFKRLNEMIKNDNWLKVNEKAIRMTGVRIPTQGPNSVEFVQVWEFLPASAGTVIIIPAEIVAKSGGDFDVDKLTMYIKYITKEGSELTDRFKTPEELDEALKKAKEKLKTLKADKATIIEDLNDFRDSFKLEAKNKRIDKEKYYAFTSYNNQALLKTLSDPKQQKFLKENFKNTYSILKNQIINFDPESYSKIEDLVNELLSSDSELSKVYSEYNYLKEYKRNFTSAIQNGFIDDIINVMQMPEMAFSLLQPNDTHIAKPISNDLKKVIQEADNETNYEVSMKTGKPVASAGVSPTAMTMYGYNLKKQQDNITGKNVLGLIALHNTFANMLSMAGTHMQSSLKVQDPSTKEVKLINVPIALRLNVNKTKVVDKALNEVEVISLSNKSDADKLNNIADVISQLMNGAVDVGKDAWISYLQGNMEVMPKILFLLQAGTPIEDIAYFVSNPMIRRYVENKTNYKSPLAKVIYGPQHRNTTTSAKNKARKELLKGVMTDDKGQLVKSNIAGFYKVLNTKYKTVGFDIESLKKVANQSFTINKEQIAGLLQYLYIEDLIEEFENLKGYLDVDTQSSIDNYAAQAKINEIKKIDQFQTLDPKIKEYFTEDSVISSFFVQEFARSLFGKNLFESRDNDTVNDYISKLLDNPIERSVLKDETGLVEETFVGRFKNALALYIFTNVIKQYKPGSTVYKGVNISDLLNENSKVKSIEQLKKDFAEKNYLGNSKSDEAYLKRGLFYIHPSAFAENEVDAFVEFSLEREYIRKTQPVNNRELNNAKNKLINSGLSIFTKRENESADDYNNRLNNTAYEYVIMHQALQNTYNNFELFRSGDNTTAKKLLSIVNEFPELSLQFDLIKQFSASPINNKQQNMSRINFKINNLTDLDQDLAEEYYQQWTKLADVNVMKVADKDDNTYISNFFKQLPNVAFLQAGLDPSEFSLNPIMPYEDYRGIIEKGTEAFYDVINKDQNRAFDILDGFYKMFKENNSKEYKKLRGRGLSYKRSIAELIKEAGNKNAYLFDKPYVQKISEGIYLINTTYEDETTKEVKTVTSGELDYLKQNNKNVTFILNDEDLKVNLNISTPAELEQAKADIDAAISNIKADGKIIAISSNGFGQFRKTQAPVSTQRTFKDEALHQAYIKGGLEAVTKLIQESKKKELDAAKQLSKEVDMLEEFEQLNSKLNKTNSENDRLIELYTILKNSKELDFEYSLNELGLTTQPQAPVSKLEGKMTFSYGVNKRTDVVSNTTFDAILKGERTATTRYKSQGNLDYWKNAKVGDIITWEGEDGKTVDVVVTKALHPLKGSGKTPEQWSKLEGWSVDYFEKNVRPKIEEAWQIEYKLATPTQAPVTEANPFKTSKIQQKVYHADKRKGLNENTLVDDMTMIFPTGVFFTTEKAYAENYAKAIGGVIYEAYVDVQKPLTTLDKQQIERLGRKPEEVPIWADSIIHKSDDAKADKYGKVGTEIVIYKPEQIKLITPTQTPITTVQSTEVKPGVSELFESNPELANAVYEALGFKVSNSSISLDKINNTKVGEVVTLFINNMPVKYKRVSENYFEGKQITKKQETDFINSLEAATISFEEFIEKEGTKVRYSLDQFIDFYLDNLPTSQITPQQKQQALQLYSQYLDTGKQDIEGFKKFTTRTTTQPTSLAGELSLYLSNKLKEEFDYNNPGNPNTISPLDILNSQVKINQQDIDDTKLNCK